MKAAICDNFGRILRVVVGSMRVLKQQTGQGNHVVVVTEGVVSDTTHYLLNGGLVERPKMELSLNRSSVSASATDVARIDNVPAGAIVRHKSGEDIVNDGVVEFTTDTPGKYSLRFSLWPYQDEEIFIDAS